MELQYLFAGFAVFWAGLLAYLVFLQARLHALQSEFTRLEERLAEGASERIAAARAPAVRTAGASPAPAEASRGGA